jgi:3'-5' exonuclease
MNEIAKINDMVALAYGAGTYVYLDIETIPTQDPDTIAAIRASVKPPSNIKKAETIEAWWAEQGKEAADKAVANTSFDGGRGHVCTVAWALNDGPVEVRYACTVADERLILADLFKAIGKERSPVIVGHYVAGFDLPFLRKRAIVLGLKLPNAFAREAKPWDALVADTMHVWAGSRDTISLDDLCRILGIPGKDGFDGSMVAAAWAAGEYQTIEDYCADDVRRVRAIHQRFMEVGL